MQQLCITLSYGISNLFNLSINFTTSLIHEGKKLLCRLSKVTQLTSIRSKILSLQILRAHCDNCFPAGCNLHLVIFDRYGTKMP